MRKQTFLFFALLLPIVILLALTFYKKHILESGTEVILPVSGYDPRDLISGHFIRYKVEYGVNNICPANAEHQTGYVCLDNKTFSLSFPENCKLFIRGICKYSEFQAGIERYYIPENVAPDLDKNVKDNKASIILSVTSNGHAQVKALLINGKSWRETNKLD